MAKKSKLQLNMVNAQVHPYTFRNENQFLHLEFHEDPYVEYDFWINQIGVDGLFTDFTGSLHNFQEWTSSKGDDKSGSKLLHEIAKLVSSYKKGWHFVSRFFSFILINVQFVWTNLVEIGL